MQKSLRKGAIVQKIFFDVLVLGGFIFFWVFLLAGVMSGFSMTSEPLFSENFFVHVGQGMFGLFAALMFLFFCVQIVRKQWAWACIGLLVLLLPVISLFLPAIYYTFSYRKFLSMHDGDRKTTLLTIVIECSLLLVFLLSFFYLLQSVHHTSAQITPLAVEKNDPSLCMQINGNYGLCLLEVARIHKNRAACDFLGIGIGTYGQRPCYELIDDSPEILLEDCGKVTDNHERAACGAEAAVRMKSVSACDSLPLSVPLRFANGTTAPNTDEAPPFDVRSRCRAAYIRLLDDPDNGNRP